MARRDEPRPVLGASFRVTRQRGVFVESALAPRVLATVHPSSILRTDGPQREAAMEAFVADLRVAAGALTG
jgi:uracil-DNA glycosylase